MTEHGTSGLNAYNYHQLLFLALGGVPREGVLLSGLSAEGEEEGGGGDRLC